MLVSAEVDLSIFVPSQFRLVFRGSRTEVLLGGGFQLGVKVNIQVTAGEAPTPLMTMAEVTAVEVEYGPDGNLTIVRGMDASHRLMSGTKAMAYPDMPSSAVVTTLVGEAGVIPGVIIGSGNVYEWLSQANVSAWVLIQQLAALENCVAYVDTLGMFNFGPMKKPEEGLPPVMSLDEPAMGTQLVMGANLIRLRGTVGGAEQVPAVTVLGYDPKMAMPVIGLSPTLPSTSQSMDPLTLPPAVAEEFQALPFFDSSRPFDDEGSAQTRAESIAADIAGALAELEGQCLGNPAIVAGEVISLGMVGPPFDGQYVCSAARHVFEPNHGGYTTWFTVGGFRDRSLYALASGAGPASESSRPNISGVAVGKVVDNMDEESQGRVKVMFPWLGATYISAWARTVQMGAGLLGGCLWLPEIGDEVLVGFDRGDIDHPYVLGNLYNGLAKPQPAPEIEGVVASRRFTSRMLNQIEFNDGPEKLGITINTSTGLCKITMDEQQQIISIESTTGQVEVKGMMGITMQSDTGNISIQAPLGQVSIQGMQGVTIEAPGGQAQLTGSTGVTLEGATVSVTSPSISLGG
jgi:hypothetical protein